MILHPLNFRQCHRFRPTQRWFHQRCGFSQWFSIMGMLRWKFECPNFETKKTHVRHKKSVSKTSPPEIWDDIYMFITPVWYHWRPLDYYAQWNRRCPTGSPCHLDTKEGEGLRERFRWKGKKSMTGIQHVQHVQQVKNKYNWLVVSTHLKNISQIGNLPQIGIK